MAIEFQSDQRNIFVALIIPSHIPGANTYLSLFHPNRETKKWSFPGGKPHAGELLSEAACREAFEELGIEPIDLKLVSHYTTRLSDGKDWLGYFFLCTEFTGIPRIVETNKHSEIRYMNLYDLILANADPEFRAVAELEVKSIQEVK